MCSQGTLHPRTWCQATATAFLDTSSWLHEAEDGSKEVGILRAALRQLLGFRVMPCPSFRSWPPGSVSRAGLRGDTGKGREAECKLGRVFQQEPRAVGPRQARLCRTPPWSQPHQGLLLGWALAVVTRGGRGARETLGQSCSHNGGVCMACSESSPEPAVFGGVQCVRSLWCCG